MPATSILQFVRRLAGQAEAVSLVDRELLDRFATKRDEMAFTALIQRHGPMVLSVCRRVLHNEQDAEDVFQATFLTLARKAGSVNDTLGGWLHAVAYHLAVKSRAAAAKRQARERQVPAKTCEEFTADLTWREVRQVLDEELERLPAKYRDVLVLCYLQELTRDQAAEQLGVPLGTLKSRLESGRQILRSRLLRRGLTLSAAFLGTLLSQSAPAAIPLSLARVTVRAAGQFVLNPLQPVAGVSSCAVELARGALSLSRLTRRRRSLGTCGF
jgi:RNA polymerase sigma factor (sigma-70 family)